MSRASYSPHHRSPCVYRCFYRHKDSSPLHRTSVLTLPAPMNMRISYYTLGAIAAACGAFVSTASPVRGLIDAFLPRTAPVEPRATFNCTDLHADFDETCWAYLGLSDYLLDPVTGWNKTTRICSTVEDGTDSDGSDCCKPDQPWSTCYLHLAHGVAGSDCSEINAQMCSWDPTMAVAPSIAPQVRYVMRNIYGR